jgi:DNA-binding transcriptional LysR family regulator
MNTDQLRLFLSIARHRSLSRAAAEMELGQATVSERLKALEAEVGTALFARQGRGVSLSPAGEAFLPYAERALDVLRQAQQSARDASVGRRGQVTVAVTVTSGAYLFAPALVAFRNSHPGVEVQVRSAHSWDATGLILDGVAQLALISGPSVHAQVESLASFRSRLVLVAGRSHPLAAGAQAGVSLEELARQRWLVSYWGPASQAFLERVRAAGEGGGDEAAAGEWMELSPVELVKGMLLAGTGVSLVPEIAVRREVAAGELVALALKAGARRLPDWEISLIRHQRRPPNAAADALAETLVRVLPGLTA